MAAKQTTLTGLAVVVREKGKFEVERARFLPPAAGQVRLKIHACGLCQSDVSAMSGKLPMAFPLVLGHEGAGVVEAVGEGTTGWEVGDHAILTLVTPCNCCSSCLSGKPSQCRVSAKLAPTDRVEDANGTKLAPFSSLGCMAEYAVVHQNSLVHVQKDIPLEKGALVSCGVTTGAGAAINRAKVFPGATCCVLGCGGVGLSAVQGARICGATQIIAIDSMPSKLEAARRFGATHTINAKDVKDVAKEVSKLSNGGTDFGFEAVGYPQTLETVVRSVKPGGTAVAVGVGGPQDKISIKMNMLTIQEKTVTGTFMGSSVPSQFVPTLLNLYKKGDLLLDELISKYYKLLDVQAAFDELATGANLRGVLVMHDLEGLAASSRL